MRTKTLALSAVLGMIGTASVVAQTNVYSLNAVGYINVTIPTGYSIVTCPLICSPDNTLNTLFPNTQSGANPATFAFLTVLPFSGGAFQAGDSANGYSPGWSGGGTLALNPGQAAFLYNTFGTTMHATFVGTVPQGTLTNNLYPGYNLVGSIVPVSGDMATNTVLNLNSANVCPFDTILFFQNGYLPGASTSYSPGWTGGAGPNGDPVLTNVAQGFFYYNASASLSPGAPNDPAGGPITEHWVETFSINP